MKENSSEESRNCENNDCTKRGDMKCTRCKSSFYCSRECQRKCWKNHKKNCKDGPEFLDIDDVLPDSKPNLCQEGFQLANMINCLGMEDNVLPPFDSEYSRKFPLDKLGYKVLNENYTKNKLFVFTKASVDFTTLINESYGTLQQILGKRWSFFSKDLLCYLLSAPAPGSIYENHPFLQMRQEYGMVHSATGTSKKIYRVLRNTPVKIQTLEKGHCYVSIGFVDLQQLLVSNIAGNEGFVEWHGYDASKICVARAKLILELLGSNLCSVKHILQIWFSTSISTQAQHAMKKACKSLSEKESDSDLRILLRFWGKHKISRRYARERTRQHLQTCSTDEIMRLTEEQDRVDFARYLLTGEVFIDEKEEIVGNSSMISLPEEFEDHTKMEESLFNTIDLRMLTNQSSLLQAVEKLLTKKLAVMKDSIQNFHLVIGLHSKDFNEKQKDLLEEVKKRNPKNIDWSNIPDYMVIEDFFRMARDCSAPKTEHSFHLMNWATKVFGASLFDYFQPDLRHQKFFHDKNGKIKQKYWELESEFTRIVKEDIGNMERFKIEPKLLDFINTSERALSQRYFGTFVNFFFQNQHVKGLVWATEPYSPFSRCNTQGDVRFTFKN